MSLNISFSDVLRYKGVDEGIFHQEEKLHSILTEMGLNLQKGLEVLYCEHRSPITNKVVKGRFYLGTERTDEDWKVTKYMVDSLERYGHTNGHLLDGRSQSFMTILKKKQLEYLGELNA